MQLNNCQKYIVEFNIKVSLKIVPCSILAMVQLHIQYIISNLHNFQTQTKASAGRVIWLIRQAINDAPRSC